MAPTSPPSPPRLSWVAFLATTALGVGLIGDAGYLYARGRGAPVSHLVSLPPLWFWIPVALLFAAAVSVGASAMVGRRAAQLSRVPLLALAVLAFVDLFLLPDVRPTLPSYDVLIPMRSLAEEVRQLTKEGRLPSTVEQLAPVVDALGSPQLLVSGERPAQWGLVVRLDCQGPVTSAAGTSAGTFLYCLRADGQRAWISAVGLTRAQFGAPEMVTQDGQLLSAEVIPRSTAAAPQPGEDGNGD